MFGALGGYPISGTFILSGLPVLEQREGYAQGARFQLVPQPHVHPFNAKCLFL